MPTPLTFSYFKYRLNFKKPAGTSRGPLYYKDAYFIRLTPLKQANIAGWGECSPQPGLSVDARPEFEAKLVELGEAIAADAEVLDLSDWPALRFGLEMAQLDLAQGGQQCLFDTPFSRGEVALPTHGLIWMGAPVAVLAQIEKKLADGASVIKMKVGALPFENECQILEQVRQAHPHIQLRLDANGAFHPDEALDKLKHLAQFDIFALEQPIKPGQWAALAEICQNSPIPIALDEELIGQVGQEAALLEQLRPAYLVLKPMLLGGFSACQNWIALAENMGIGWWVNSMLESNLGLSATAQWVSSLPTGPVHGLGTGQLFSNNIASPLQFRQNALHYQAEAHPWDFGTIC